MAGGRSRSKSRAFAFLARLDCGNGCGRPTDLGDGAGFKEVSAGAGESSRQLWLWSRALRLQSGRGDVGLFLQYWVVGGR
jgi:hypothetical protein